MKKRIHLPTAAGAAAKHVILILFSLLAIFPIIIIVMNSFKSRVAIFSQPYSLPTAATVDLIGYETVFSRANFPLYYANSIIIAAVSMFIILFLGSMVAFALARYDFKLKGFLSVFFLLGIIIPIRLASVSLLELMQQMSLTNTRTGLILIYCAQGLPLAVLIITRFMEDVPKPVIEAARLEGAGEFRIYLLTLPMVKPAIATVGTFSIIPIWNDIWFPLIIAPSEKISTVTMGARKFLGQFSSDWNAVLASLTLAIVPVLVFYLIISKQILRGIVDGAVK